jgi:hypothetical protein
MGVVYGCKDKTEGYGKMKTTLTATTPHGTFTRKTSHNYKFVCVREYVGAEGIKVSWHGTKAAADAKASLCGAERHIQGFYFTDRSTLHGVYPVDGTTGPAL